jgi:hypothetical protein
MYAIRYHNDEDRGMLVQMPAKELNKFLFSLEKTYPRFTWISAESARRWVKEGYPHETPLYVNDEGKVRYAKDSN